MALEKTTRITIPEYNRLFDDLISKNGWVSGTDYQFDRSSWNSFMDATQALAPKLKTDYPYLAFAANKLLRYTRAVHGFSQTGLEGGQSGQSFLEGLIGYPIRSLWRFNPEEMILNSGIPQSPLTTVQEALERIIPYLEQDEFDCEEPLFRCRRHEKKGNDFFSFDPNTAEWVQYDTLPFNQSNEQQALLNYEQQLAVNMFSGLSGYSDFPQSLLPSASQQLGLFVDPASDSDYFESEILITGRSGGTPGYTFPIDVRLGDVLANLARNYLRILGSLNKKKLDDSKTPQEYVGNSKVILEASKLKNDFCEKFKHRNN